MFAIFLTEPFQAFFRNIFSFPTVFFTFFLAICTVFWLVSILGVLNIDILDIDLPDPDADIDAGSAPGASSVLAGLMLKFGLNGVPFTIILTLISFLGWIICYFIVHFTFEYLPWAWLNYALSLPVILVSLYFSCLITGQMLKPIRKWFPQTSQSTSKNILGQTAVVRTSRVDDQFGEAFLDDGGAGLIVKVRAAGEEKFKQGDRIVLLEYLKEIHAYRVISEKEFNGSF